MIKNYIKRKWDWVDRNPRLAVWISFFKGIIFGIVIMCLASCEKPQYDYCERVDIYDGYGVYIETQEHCYY